MSYQVIARKWRPQTFDQVTGQEHVTRALRNAVLGSRIPHALVLAGPRGVGKTTLARILARALNCDDGPTDSPCGTCAPCTDIITGNSSDVQEIDAASRTGVNDIRAVIEAIRYAPSPGKHRIFVIDEHENREDIFDSNQTPVEEGEPGKGHEQDEGGRRHDPRCVPFVDHVLGEGDLGQRCQDKGQGGE